MEKPILIMGSDDHARAVEAYMLGAGHPVMRFSSTDSLQVYGDDYNLALRLPNGFHCDERSIKRMYWRTYDGVEYHPEHVVTHNRRSIFESWLKVFEQVSDCWNGWSAWSMHQTKPYQHMQMSDVHGLRVSYVASSLYGPVLQDMQSARKCVQGGIMASGPGTWLDTEAPFLHQQAILGSTFRIFVFNDHPCEYIAYRIKTNEFDYRRDPKPGIVREAVCDAVVDDLNDIICWLGWNWAGVDLIYNDQGWGILDVNPSPMFLGWDSEQAVLRKLCACLMR